ncbi:MAG TPA: hypothetical protein VH720_14910 [Candidatus Limnocylindrales bacterium]|jgi:hypothetical protein
MITGAHAILYSPKADEVRAFLIDLLGTTHVDAGDGWLIARLPPAELAVHPADAAGRVELYLMTDDLAATIDRLRAKGVETAPVTDQGWGLLTTVRLPDGAHLGLYQPRHATAIDR